MLKLAGYLNMTVEGLGLSLGYNCDYAATRHGGKGRFLALHKWQALACAMTSPWKDWC